ncbi:HAMP domain-containing histidine kinase [Leeuwenhoekiella palythoae]|uniref:sensor histidine kinase n=1 Tax=Leeuwenhoekiella palythoae TaxID=573501 RepID=UPI001CE111A1|nr:HAMP domain-containing sensor histidine kinase [Leeuwenhoekiella palythoae]UBZ09015.1 HAMP domain-containing histidine kinase [Leeuwenhoekiella palythoae]
MKNRRYSILIYFISAVILITLSIQFYWNIKNYETERFRLIDEMQASLDNAVDNYYTILAQNNTVGFFLDQKTAPKNALTNQMDSLIKRIDLSSQGFKGLDSLDSKKIKGIKVLRGTAIDSFIQIEDSVSELDSQKAIDSLIITAKNLQANDSIEKNPWSIFTSKVVISITEDTIQMKKMDSLLNIELMRRDINIDKSLEFVNSNGKKQTTLEDIKSRAGQSTYSTSSLLPKGSSLNLYFTNYKATLFKRILGGVILSTVLIACVIACLLFLLKIINRQKQLAEVKNDLISNITHEFKTPIATISVALEGIKNFNRENDPVKTGNYVNTSTAQLDKLTMMVEKLLETATLDGEELALNKEEINLNEILENLVQKHQTLAPEKSIRFTALRENNWILGDAFHLDNALNNLLDNAVKYGGDTILVELENLSSQIEIRITDSGTSLSKAEAKQIFEKFYRVPKGNTHDVKGFGIGLYYTQKIIEKHGGSIDVSVTSQTTFKIELPHA